MSVRVNRNKLLIYSISIPTTTAVILGVTVGGYFLSYNSNPFLSYGKAPINSSIEAYQAVYYSYLINNANLMVLPGFSLAESMNASLLDPKYNDAAFLLIDSDYSGPSTSQVASAGFRSDQGSFVTGIAIAMYLNEYKEYFMENDEPNNKKLTWGTYGGMPFSSVSSFMVGIQLGIAWFNTEIANKYPDKYLPIEQITLGSNAGDNYSYGFGANDGDNLIERFLQYDIDCLVPVSGPQALTAANKIVSKNKRTIVIGVDSAAEDDSVIKTKKLPNGLGVPENENKQIVPFSSLKNVGLMTYNILNNLQKGYSYNQVDNNQSNIGGLGYQSLGTIENSCVGVSENGQKYFVNAMKIYDSNITTYEQATEKLKSIEVFNNLNTDDYRKFVVKPSLEGVEIDINSYIEAAKNISNRNEWQQYLPLPSQGMALESMSKEVPSDLTNNFTQQDWDYKIDAPNRIKKLLDPKTSGFDNRIKIALSTPTSVLLDASFSQSCYDGVAAFYKNNKVYLPFTNSTQSLINLIETIKKSNSENSSSKKEVL
ncbi:MAG: BMP family ABC transporter substrate-binding protein [Ureaplasma sp.]|nr:BMP family ABC transporter substrate-binding protein [Ureaplasma sp.]